MSAESGVDSGHAALLTSVNRGESPHSLVRYLRAYWPAVAAATLTGVVCLASLLALNRPPTAAVRTVSLRSGGEQIAWLAPSGAGSDDGLPVGRRGPTSTRAGGLRGVSGLRGPLGYLKLARSRWFPAAVVIGLQRCSFALGLEFLSIALVVFLLASDRQAACRFLDHGWGRHGHLARGPRQRRRTRLGALPRLGRQQGCGRRDGPLLLRRPGPALAAPSGFAIVGALAPILALYTYSFLGNPALYDLTGTSASSTWPWAAARAQLPWPGHSRTGRRQGSGGCGQCSSVWWLLSACSCLAAWCPTCFTGRYWVRPEVRGPELGAPAARVRLGDAALPADGRAARRLRRALLGLRERVRPIFVVGRDGRVRPG